MRLFVAGFGAGVAACVAVLVWATPEAGGTLRELREAGQAQHGEAERWLLVAEDEDE